MCSCATAGILEREDSHCWMGVWTVRGELPLSVQWIEEEEEEEVERMTTSSGFNNRKHGTRSTATIPIGNLLSQWW